MVDLGRNISEKPKRCCGRDVPKMVMKFQSKAQSFRVNSFWKKVPFLCSDINAKIIFQNFNMTEKHTPNEYKNVLSATPPF